MRARSRSVDVRVILTIGAAIGIDGSLEVGVRLAAGCSRARLHQRELAVIGLAGTWQLHELRHQAAQRTVRGAVIFVAGIGFEKAGPLAGCQFLAAEQAIAVLVETRKRATIGI